MTFKPILGSGQDIITRAYRRCFTDMPAGTLYWDPLRDVNEYPRLRKTHEPALRAFDDAQKEGASFGAAVEHVRKTLQLSDWTLPIAPLRDIFAQVFTSTPVYDVTRRVSHPLLDLHLDRLNTLGSAKWKAEGGTPDMGEETYAPYTVKQKFAMTKGKTTGPMQVFGGQLRNVQGFDQALKMTQVARLLENTIINGNPAAADGTGGPGDALAFKGLRQEITDLADATLDIDPAGVDTQLTRADIRKAKKGIWKYGGLADLAITDPTTYDDFKATLEANYGVNVVNPNTKLQAFGLESYTFDGLTFVKSDVMPDVNGARECLVVDSRAYALHVGQDMMMEPLAKTGDADEFMVKHYSVLGNFQPRHLARVKDLA